MRVLAASLFAASHAQIDPATVVEIGEAIYQAVKDNQPVIDTAVDWAGAVPKGVTAWTQLENWQGPAQSDGFYIEFKNKIGMKLTKFSWRFVWKYVTQAGIDIDTAYAYLSEHLNVEVQSLKPVNYGTSANPVGGVDVQVSVSSHGLFEKTTKVCTMTVKGDGTSALGDCAQGKFGLAPSNESPPAIDPATVVEIGKTLYKAIVDNQPTLDTTVDWAGAVPKGVADWTQLENWQGPAQSDLYSAEFKNFLGMKLARFSWRFVWKYGGDLGGVGKYVTQAGIDIDSSSAFLAEHLDVDVKSVKPVNYGDADTPVGGVDIQVSVASHGLKNATKVCTMTVKGDGTSVLGTCESGTFGHDGEAVVV